MSEDQINMIVNAIKNQLSITPDDIVLELACGNGSISHHLFNSCQDYLGVDLSEYLISVAKNNFERLPHYEFKLQGAADYVRQEKRPERFSKVLCYASFCYFPQADAIEVLNTLYKKFTHVQAVLIGNLPDKDRAKEFYKTKQPNADELLDHSTAIGAWRTRGEFEELCGNTGWNVKFSTMPPEYFSSYYRYDALLCR